MIFWLQYKKSVFESRSTRPVWFRTNSFFHQAWHKYFLSGIQTSLLIFTKELFNSGFIKRGFDIPGSFAGDKYFLLC